MTSAGWENLPTSIGKKCVDGYLAPLTQWRIQGGGPGPPPP